VRVLLDECIDWRLGRELAFPRGEDRASNGVDDAQERRVAALASAQFDLFVTVDRNLFFQQDIVSFGIAVVVLQARTNRLADLRPLVPSLLSAIEGTSPGTAKFIAPS
jgi:predicted nuclease of predicted toxin-antitoxin system